MSDLFPDSGSDGACSLIDCAQEADPHRLTMDDFAGALPRWCPGCGDHAILSGAQRLLETERLRPEKTVFVSGIGCSSRFPHYLSTYGFHGIHGRALPVATGVKLSRPDLDVFVVMGDGDCCSIGAAHWVHALRYNVDMVALMLDNNIYGLTKNQTSPTTPAGHKTNTQPKGSYLPALNPLQTTLGVTNISFVAQTADWVPWHLYQTMLAAHRHKGFAFVRILQRCPVWTPTIFQEAIRRPEQIELVVHDDGVPGDDESLDIYKSRLTHDPADLDAARRLADPDDRVRLGVFYRKEDLPRYDVIRRPPHRSAAERLALLNAELDKHAV